MKSLIVLLIFVTVSFPQKNNNNDSSTVKPKPLKNQVFYEDSLHVFWTGYPDPFSFPSFSNRRRVTRALTIFCDLPGKVDVGIMNSRKDTIIYKFNVNSFIQNTSTFRVWVSDSTFDIKNHTYQFLKKDFAGPIYLAVFVDNKLKTLYLKPIKVPLNYNIYFTGTGFKLKKQRY